MNIIIRRYRHKPETIDGELYIDGLKICDTAENTNGALPEGTYPVTLRKCKQYERKMLLLNPKSPCAKCPRWTAAATTRLFLAIARCSSPGTESTNDSTAAS